MGIRATPRFRYDESTGRVFSRVKSCPPGRFLARISVRFRSLRSCRADVPVLVSSLTNLSLFLSFSLPRRHRFLRLRACLAGLSKRAVNRARRDAQNPAACRGCPRVRGICRLVPEEEHEREEELVTLCLVPVLLVCPVLSRSVPP